jgi:hypothetical protein
MATEVGAIDTSKKSSEVLGPTSDEATVQMDQLEEKCYWNDAEFSTGDQVTSEGVCYECSFGRWIQSED